MPENVKSSPAEAAPVHAWTGVFSCPQFQLDYLGIKSYNSSMNNTITINGEKCVTMTEAAVALDCSYSRIAWLVERTLLTAIIPGGREKFITVKSIHNISVGKTSVPRPGPIPNTEK
jgi:hypothetical protein